MVGSPTVLACLSKLEHGTAGSIMMGSDRR